MDIEDRRKLEKVQICAAEKVRADEEFKRAILEAYAEAFTLRQIAECAGVSRETVRTIVIRKGKGQ